MVYWMVKYTKIEFLHLYDKNLNLKMHVREVSGDVTTKMFCGENRTAGKLVSGNYV